MRGEIGGDGCGRARAAPKWRDGVRPTGSGTTSRLIAVRSLLEAGTGYASGFRGSLPPPSPLIARARPDRRCGFRRRCRPKMFHVKHDVGPEEPAIAERRSRQGSRTSPALQLDGRPCSPRTAPGMQPRPVRTATIRYRTRHKLLQCGDGAIGAPVLTGRRHNEHGVPSSGSRCRSAAQG